MATPRADLTGIERKKTLSCGAVRFTRPRPSVARNIRMMTGADTTTVVRSMPSSEPSATAEAFGESAPQSPNTGQSR